MPDPADTLDLDPVTSAVLFSVARLGYVVNIRRDGELYVATGYRDGKTFIVRHPIPSPPPSS